VSRIPSAASNGARADFTIIADMVRPGTRVLDLGCGDGSLMKFLGRVRGARGYGVEIADANVLAAMKNGVNVLQGNLERGLRSFADGSFDTVILSQTLQAMHNIEGLMRDMLRVGREAVVSASSRRGACRSPTPCRTCGTTRPTCTCAPCWISRICAPAWASRSSSGSRWPAGVR
jgi:ubiquinone/menaquinone biosynthesis C-methylase UbiE